MAKYSTAPLAILAKPAVSSSVPVTPTISVPLILNCVSSALPKADAPVILKVLSAKNVLVALPPANTTEAKSDDIAEMSTAALPPDCWP